MKSGSIIYDGVDLFQEFGVFVTKGGYNQMLAYPSTEPIITNDWQEEDYKEADLSELMLSPKEFDMTFACVGKDADYNGFLEFMENTLTARDMDMHEIGLSLALRPISNPNHTYYEDKFRTFSYRFSLDKPHDLLSIGAENGIKTNYGSYEVLVDSASISRWGIMMVKGTYSSLYRGGSVKKPLVRKVLIKDSEGKWIENFVDESKNKARRQSKDVTLMLFLRADDTATAWANYYGFLKWLVRKNGLAMHKTDACKRNVVIRDKAFNCHYKSASVQKFFAEGNGKVWLEFSVTLSVIN